MAILGAAIRRGEGPEVDYVSVGEVIRSKRRWADRPVTMAEARFRRNCYWLGLWLAGVPMRSIASDSGFGVLAVRRGITAARLRLAAEREQEQRRA